MEDVKGELGIDKCKNKSCRLNISSRADPKTFSKDFEPATDFYSKEREKNVRTEMRPERKFFRPGRGCRH